MLASCRYFTRQFFFHGKKLTYGLIKTLIKKIPYITLQTMALSMEEMPDLSEYKQINTIEFPPSRYWSTATYGRTRPPKCPSCFDPMPKGYQADKSAEQYYCGRCCNYLFKTE